MNADDIIPQGCLFRQLEASMIHRPLFGIYSVGVA